MGIKGLAKLLSDEAPNSIREVSLSSLHGRKIAIDASMAIYQFLIAVRSAGAAGNHPATMLTNAEGETTSHIQGLFNRTIRFLTEGVKPVYVFDGKPPQFKSGELMKRREKREKAEKALQAAKEEGNVEEEEKQSKRLVRAGQRENDDCKKLLQLMGVPVVEAPCEAEAQAASMCQAGLVYATGTEDMDALTFATPLLLRKMTFANASKSMIQTMNYQKAMEELNLTHEQFVDLCILLGCDYCDSIRGVGPKTALKLIRQHGDIETILQHLDQSKYGIPQDWLPSKVEYDTDQEQQDEQEFIPAYAQARRLFLHHNVQVEGLTLKWEPCQPEALFKFLVDEMGFNPERVKSSIEKLQKAYKGIAKPQARMDSFFAVKPAAAGTKRKAAPVAKKKATGFFGKKKR